MIELVHYMVRAMSMGLYRIIQVIHLFTFSSRYASVRILGCCYKFATRGRRRGQGHDGRAAHEAG